MEYLKKSKRINTTNILPPTAPGPHILMFFFCLGVYVLTFLQECHFCDVVVFMCVSFLLQFTLEDSRGRHGHSDARQPSTEPVSTIESRREAANEILGKNIFIINE